MRVDVDVRGDLRAEMQAQTLAGEKAVTRAVRSAGAGLKQDWRAQVRAAGLGTRLGRTIRANTYPPRGESLDAASLVYTRAPKVIGAFDEGALIKSRESFWLAIPTEAAGKRGLGGKRVTPGGWERRTGIRLRFVYRRGKPSLLVADGARVAKDGRAARKGGRRRRTDGILKGEQTVVVFVLVPQVKLRKRLDLNRDARRWLDRLPLMIVRKWAGS